MKSISSVVFVVLILLCNLKIVDAEEVPVNVNFDNKISETTVNRAVNYPHDIVNLIRSGDNLLTSFRPIYVGYSMYSKQTNEEEVKFQLSFKYNISNNIYLGYTQKSIWNISKKSTPIKETDYSPEIFYIHNNENSTYGKNSWIPYQFMLTGFRHESNGGTGTESHGWNMLYIEPYFALSKNKNLVISPSLWYPFTSSHNKELIDNIGIGKLILKWQPNNLFQFSSAFSHGLKGNAYGIEGKIDHFLRHSKYWFNPSLFVQVWNGYGEMLGTNAINTTRIIIGLSASR